MKPALGRFFEGDEQRDTLDAHPIAVPGNAMYIPARSASRIEPMSALRTD
jgi:hypothetical protein